MARKSQNRDAASWDEKPPAEPQTCWLCERPLGERVEWHHPLPKSRGGRLTVPVHPICHRTIHALFSNLELAKQAGTGSALKRDPAIARFLDWIANKPPDFNAPTRKAR
ncbi:MAG TPA: HNH endonuclease [Tianweitania sediminis]|jgi:hypothetical protein|nr:HNH endonuclease [Tianweitania sediminis]